MLRFYEFTESVVSSDVTTGLLVTDSYDAQPLVPLRDFRNWCKKDVYQITITQPKTFFYLLEESHSEDISLNQYFSHSPIDPSSCLPSSTEEYSLEQVSSNPAFQQRFKLNDKSQAVLKDIDPTILTDLDSS